MLKWYFLQLEVLEDKDGYIKNMAILLELPSRKRQDYTLKK
jgi:hypothetical protein